VNPIIYWTTSSEVLSICCADFMRIGVYMINSFVLIPHAVYYFLDPLLRNDYV